MAKKVAEKVVEKVAEKPVQKKGNWKFSTGDTSSFTGSTVIAGKPFQIVCKKGIVETNEELLANHLRTMYKEVR